MEIDVSKQQGNVPVTVVSPHGDLDGSTYTQLISKVRALVMGGARDFVIDLSDVPFMSSAGLMAIFSVALMLQGEKVPDLESGKAALKTMDRNRATDSQKHVKLLSPSEGVAETFDKVGFMRLFGVYSNLQEALASF